MTGRRFSMLPGSLQGRGQPPVDPRAAAAMANGVPMIGQRREVTCQLVTNDGSQVLATDVVKLLMGMLGQQLNEPTVAALRANILAGKEPAGVLIGDAQCTLAILDEIDAVRARINAVAVAHAARQKAAAGSQPATVSVPHDGTGAVEDGPAPVTEGS